jgi:hypothetical protein
LSATPGPVTARRSLAPTRSARQWNRGRERPTARRGARGWRARDPAGRPQTGDQATLRAPAFRPDLVFFARKIIRRAGVVNRQRGREGRINPAPKSLRAMQRRSLLEQTAGDRPQRFAEVVARPRLARTICNIIGGMARTYVFLFVFLC